MRRLKPEPEIRVRRMGEDDLPAVMEIQQAAFRHPWSLELLKRELSHDWSTVLLAEEVLDGAPVSLAGFVIFWVVHDELHVLNVATAPLFRRTGIAKLLLKAALEHGRAHRCALATLEVRRSNQAAIELYKSNGFRSVGVRPNYYVDESEDAIIMVADL